MRLLVRKHRLSPGAGYAEKLTTLAIMSAVLAVAGCNTSSLSEIARVASPDSLFDATIVRDGGDATTPDGYLVFLMPRGAPLPPAEYSRFAAYHVDSLAIAWASPAVLDITFLHATIGKFVNHWTDNRPENLDRTIEIRLRPLDPSTSLRTEIHYGR